MTTSSGADLVWDPRCLDYNFGPQHPLAPVRVELTHALIHACGLVVDDVAVEDLDDAWLLRAHEREYVDAVRAVSRQPDRALAERFGLGPGDTPAFAGMHDAALRICAASVTAATRVLGPSAHAFNPAGGLHHAMPDRAAGFCVYNDVAVAIHALLEAGAERICYVDIDVHHGDGVERIFWDDQRVLTISLHETGTRLFPGTGAIDDIGGPNAQGSAVNLPLHPGTDGRIWLDVFDAAVVPLVEAFDADVLVTQLGCDSHARDPLAHLMLTVDDMGAIYRRLHELAHAVTGGRWTATGGGGYQLVDVVPRAWTLAFAEMVGRHVPLDVPMSWRELAGQRTGETPPVSFTDDPVVIGDAMRAQARAVADEAVAGVRALVFPRHGR